MSDTLESIHKSTSCPSVSLLYIDGKSFCITGMPAEFDVEQRTGWIERQIRKTNDFSIDNIAHFIKMSIFWKNYIQHGCKYKCVSQQTYNEWDHDKLRSNFL